MQKKKKQTTITHGEGEQNQSKLTQNRHRQMNQHTKNIKTVIITIFHVFKKPEEGQMMLSEDMESNFRKSKLWRSKLKCLRRKIHRMGLIADQTLQKKILVTMKTLSKLKLNPLIQTSVHLKHKKENYTKAHHNKILKRRRGHSRQHPKGVWLSAWQAQKGDSLVPHM